MSFQNTLTPKSLPDFEYAAPSNLEEAQRVLNQFPETAMILAGGTDLMYLMKKGANARAPKILVDIKNIVELRGISLDSEGSLRIGSLTTVSTIENSDIIRNSYPILAESATAVGSPQIRNVATVGGCLCQQVWCWFLREGLKCWRLGGNTCYALAEGADNRYYHSVMGGEECYAVHPSDLAVCIKALDGKVMVIGPESPRTFSFDEFLPGNVWVDGILQSHMLRRNEILKEVLLPPPKKDTFGIYLRAALRDVFDFPIVSLALLVTLDGRKISDVRAVFGGIAPAPYRDTTLEVSLLGNQLGEDLRSVIEKKTLTSASPLENNGYKVQIAKGLTLKAVRKLIRLSN
jgi:xanthine dehydrogenase YagS FAD-binding subunit